MTWFACHPERSEGSYQSLAENGILPPAQSRGQNDSLN